MKQSCFDLYQKYIKRDLSLYVFLLVCDMSRIMVLLLESKFLLVLMIDCDVSWEMAGVMYDHAKILILFATKFKIR